MQLVSTAVANQPDRHWSVKSLWLRLLTLKLMTLFKPPTDPGHAQRNSCNQNFQSQKSAPCWFKGKHIQEPIGLTGKNKTLNQTLPMCIQLLNHSLLKDLETYGLINVWQVCVISLAGRHNTWLLTQEVGLLWTFTTTAPVSRSQFMCKKGLEQPFKCVTETTL